MDLPDSLKEQKQRDHALYYIEEPDSSFSPERNKAMVAESIRRTNENRRKKTKEFNDKVGERVDAVVTYLRSRVAEGSTPIERYFGKRQLAHLRGQQILRTIRTKINGKMRTIHLPNET